MTSLGSGNQHVMDTIHEYEAEAAARFRNDWQTLANRRSGEIAGLALAGNAWRQTKEASKKCWWETAKERGNREVVVAQ